MTRQRAWQMRKLAENKCQICGKVRVSSAFCLEHLIAERQRIRIKGKHRKWSFGKFGTIPLEVKLNLKGGEF